IAQTTADSETMSENSTQNTPARTKCAQCGLVNRVADEICRRCGASLIEDKSWETPSESETEPQTRAIPVEDVAIYQPKRRPFLKRQAWILGNTVIMLFFIYAWMLLK